MIDDRPKAVDFCVVFFGGISVTFFAFFRRGIGDELMPKERSIGGKMVNKAIDRMPLAVFGLLYVRRENAAFGAEIFNHASLLSARRMRL